MVVQGTGNGTLALYEKFEGHLYYPKLLFLMLHHGNIREIEPHLYTNIGKKYTSVDINPQFTRIRIVL